MKIAYYIVFFFIICYATESHAQEPSRPSISPSMDIDSLAKLLETNSLPSFQDSIQNEPDSLDVNISPDALTEEFDYGAQDSQRVELLENKVHLFGDAYVNYKEMSIKAGYIVFDLDENEAIASTLTNAAGEKIGTPTFSDGSQNLTYEKLRFNFKTQKGLVYNARSQQGNLYIFGATTKFISHESDSLQLEDEIYNRNAVITTCNHEHPHYGIRTRKLKVVPDKLAILGPANLEIAGIPTPLVLPFGFLPIIGGGGQTNGLIFPQDYEYSAELGFGLREVGYYYRMNENYEFRLTGDIYTRGSWGIRLGTNYYKKYKYRGNFQIGYSKQIVETQGELEPRKPTAFSLRLSHNQDGKAHPYRNIRGTINFTTNDFDRRNYNDVNSQIENVINSNFGYTHRMPSTPFNFSAQFGHSQNTRTRQISFTLPDIQLRMNAIQPFKRKVQTGGEKWFERINLRYTGKFKSFVSTQDTLLFTKQTIDNWELGFSHDVNTSTSFNIFKFINVSPSIDYDETWYFKENVREQDTSEVQGFNDVLNTNFNTYRDLNATVNMSTNIFGTVQFKKGWLRGLRHVIKPNIGFNYSPSTNRYLEIYEDPDNPEDVDLYSPFPSGVFGRPRLREKQMALTYGLTNIFEGKYFSKRDSTEKKFKIFNTVTLNGSRNFALDSLQWSRVRVNGTARFFNGVTSINLQATLDPYIEVDNRRVNQTVWSDRNRFLRFEDFTARFTTSFSFSQIKDLFKKKDEDNRTNSSRQSQTKSTLFSLLEQFRVAHNIDFSINQKDGVNNFEIRNNSIRIQGSNIRLTDKWSVSGINMSYDFNRKTVGYPSFGLTRQLHCWNMRFNWQPLRGTYSFFIGVTASDLGQFLKYNYGQNVFDGQRLIR